MHDQHRSPDPTKIERATATSTVALFIYIFCSRIFITRQRGGQSPSEMAVGSVEKDVGSQTHHAFMVCHMYVWIGTPTVQLVSRGNAADNSLTKFNSYTMKKVFHADMQLSSPSKRLLVSPYSFCHGWSDTFIYLQTKTANL